MTDNNNEKQETAPAAAAARCVVLYVYARGKKDSKARTPQASLEEAIGLADSINLDVAASLALGVARYNPSTLIGSGQVDSIRALMQEQQAGLLIVDHVLSPIQQRNLETELKCKVIDRTGLILEIFGERARTREGMLQVELASLSYQQSRLVRSWTHLERQRGGFGFLGGPGERQIELDRRMIGTRIDKIKGELVEVRRTRGLQRAARAKRAQPLVALVGYTNAGKSTLFNKLSSADVLAKDLLFATLDPTMRTVELTPQGTGTGRSIMLSDTVGFIADLPTHLVEAFQATLEEVENADIILHVRDVSHPDSDAQRADVMKVLDGLGIAENDPRIIEVLNKTDLLDAAARNIMTSITVQRRLNDEKLVAISAVTGQGLEELNTLLLENAFPAESQQTIKLPYTAGAALAWLYQNADVLNRVDGEDAIELEVAIGPEEWQRFQKTYPQ